MEIPFRGQLETAKKSTIPANVRPQIPSGFSKSLLKLNSLGILVRNLTTALHGYWPGSIAWRFLVVFGVGAPRMQEWRELLALGVAPFSQHLRFFCMREVSMQCTPASMACRRLIRAERAEHSFTGRALIR